jgi:hypothetical protein
MGFMTDEVDLGYDFSEHFDFPLPVILPIAPRSSLSSGTGATSHIVAAVPRGVSLAPPYIKGLFRVPYLEVLPVIAVGHVTDVQFAVGEVSNIPDGSRWRLQKVRYHVRAIVRVE